MMTARSVLEVTGTEKYGVANIWDAEMVIYIASIIQDKINKGEKVDSIVSFTAHDFFRVVSTKPNGSAYDRGNLLGYGRVAGLVEIADGARS
jgi:plasmid replication initiation protein